MSAKVIDGKALSKKLREQIKKDAESLKSKGICPSLSVIIVGEDPASKTYVKNKRLACEEVGIKSDVYELPESTTSDELLSLVKKLNADESVHGILVQLPLPKHLDEKVVIENIRIDKDVDAFHPQNVGRIMIGDFDFLPCTPAGVMEIIDEAGVEVKGKECVVVGRSNIVGKPQAMLLLHRHGTVTLCHSRTKDLKEVTRRAEILVAAVGKAKMITADMVRPGAVVIDVGMNRDENGKLCGDVDFDGVKEVASVITPVPGGVGPLTITMLLKNTIKAAQLKLDKKS
ncbi:MAG: bifunctional methylenetetrahydrofolate dehydrogenase/methenyltetrahydrofolate cyclohydrolase FolD [Clostridia bacterium]|nr:bifunctional methylenetetrahydrofolate dehydrogenase/methenyltetrahydrofolate cyclohydrolase FolD [Clostridia bacterium]MBQ1434491.1 bifunctional methylenetetrahydrofolate dehydrogenase/methenyltetrahydrofolate cyclohydrolase FolD [Clostridia bacterium]